MQRKNKEEYNAYMRRWRAEHRAKVAGINRRYYLRNKGYLNKSRTKPWTSEQVIHWIKTGNPEYIMIMDRILRPEKDPFINLDRLER